MTAGFAHGQDRFSFDEYNSFKESVSSLSADDHLSLRKPSQTYYSEIQGGDLATVAYLDSINTKCSLTPDEIELLGKNDFFVSERLSFYSLASAYSDIYTNDLPVFISSDTILHSLHASYDKILQSLELSILIPNLKNMLQSMHDSFASLESSYSSEPRMKEVLADVDLYIVMAQSLLEGSPCALNTDSQEDFDKLWDAVQAEMAIEMPLFSETPRAIDFSQFKPRGHYTDSPALENYFKCMTWLGRIDFLMTPPEYVVDTIADDIPRMIAGAVLLNELIDSASVRDLLKANDSILDFMVGNSDNLTSSELSNVLDEMEISALSLLDNDTCKALEEALKNTPEAQQRILSDILTVDPKSNTPDQPPVSFRLMGQRFTIDSYIFSNLVYDKIIVDDVKIKRMMPDPLDVMFVLGNDDALPLLESQLEEYSYSAQLETLRYLVESYDGSFWEDSLYNMWLQSIRALNPVQNSDNQPFFMKTTAWHQEKLNTQLASWTQLRHDTILYVKQSYTGGGATCSYPHSYVEPYPELYRGIAAFAERAEGFFSQLESANDTPERIARFYGETVQPLMLRLAELADKELSGQAFTEEECEFLSDMLETMKGCGGPFYSGWLPSLYYDWKKFKEDYFLVADVHTQPTDEEGRPLGKVLHVGNGLCNLGVFIAQSPSNDFQRTAFIGPVMSYYEHITENFQRLNDDEWAALLRSDDKPDRPDWVNSYLVDNSGVMRPAGRALPGEIYEQIPLDADDEKPSAAMNVAAYPNPFNPATTIQFTVPGRSKVAVTIFDILGRKVAVLADENMSSGSYSLTWDASGMPSGVYFCRVRAGSKEKTEKMMLMK